MACIERNQITAFERFPMPCRVTTLERFYFQKVIIYANSNNMYSIFYTYCCLHI
jgi:hypothetical protein